MILAVSVLLATVQAFGITSVLQPPSGGWLERPRGGSWALVPHVDVKENDNELTIHADVPGVKPEDLEVHLDAKSNTVTISGSRHSEKNEQSDKFHVVERTFGSFARSFHVPAGVKEQDISAEFVNGVLGVKVLKPKSADKGTKIKIATPPATSAKHASEL